jgi:hypothetical protein
VLVSARHCVHLRSFVVRFDGQATGALGTLTVGDFGAKPGGQAAS